MMHKFILTRLTIAALATCNALTYTAAHKEQTLDKNPIALQEAYDTDLLWSIYFDKPEVIADLLTKGVDLQKLHDIGTDKYTVLYYAVDQENPVLVQQLLNAGADPNQKSTEITPLFKAVTLNVGNKKGQINRKKIVESLLAHKADPAMQSGDDKQSPLHGIAQHQYIRNDYAFPLIQLLLDAGASNKQKNTEGLTPVAAARKAFTQYTNFDPDIAPMFAARAAFIKAYPGKTELQRLAVELTLHFCSSVKSIKTQALENINAIRAGEKGAELQAELEKFLPDFPALLSGYVNQIEGEITCSQGITFSHFTHTRTKPDGTRCRYNYDNLETWSNLKPYIYDGFGICRFAVRMPKGLLKQYEDELRKGT